MKYQLLVFLLGVSACGKKDNEKQETVIKENETLSLVDSHELLPTCETTIKDKLYFVSQSKKMMSCDGEGQWNVVFENGKSCNITSIDSKRSKISCADGNDFFVENGKDGIDGKDGASGTDGESCQVAKQEDGQSKVSCANGSIFITDGIDGKDGIDCKVSRDEELKQSTITCGEQSVIIADGAKGQNGADGQSCTIDDNSFGVEITCGDKTLSVNDGATGRTGYSGSDGSDGRNGVDGEDGRDGQDKFVTEISDVKILVADRYGITDYNSMVRCEFSLTSTDQNIDSRSFYFEIVDAEGKSLGGETHISKLSDMSRLSLGRYSMDLKKYAGWAEAETKATCKVVIVSNDVPMFTAVTGQEYITIGKDETRKVVCDKTMASMKSKFKNINGRQCDVFLGDVYADWEWDLDGLGGMKIDGKLIIADHVANFSYLRKKPVKVEGQVIIRNTENLLKVELVELVGASELLIENNNKLEDISGIVLSDDMKKIRFENNPALVTDVEEIL